MRPVMRLRRSRPDVRPAPLDVLVGWALIALALLPIRWGRPRTGPAYDFGVYRAAGQSVLHHLGLYGPDFLVRAQFHDGFTYPPFAALLFVPFALVPRLVAYSAWFIACLFMLTAVVRISFPGIRRPLHILAITAPAVLTVPVAEGLSLGQVGIPLTLLCLADFTNRARRVPRGVMVGLATAIKLTPAIFIAHYALTGQWRAFRNAVMTTATAWVLAYLVLPNDSIKYFGDGLFRDYRRAGSIYEVANQSLWGTTHRWLGSGANLAWLVLAFIVGAGGLILARQRRKDPLTAATILGITALLVSPVSWMHGAIWLLPAAGILWRRGRRLSALAIFALACVLVPHPSPTGLMFLRLWHESLVAGYLAVIFALWRRRRRPGDEFFRTSGVNVRV